MKRFLSAEGRIRRGGLTFLFIFISFSSFSQITLKSTDLPKSGKIYNLSTATPFTGMDATLTDTNYLWDYSLLSTTRNGGRVDSFLSVSQTAQLYSLAFLINSNHAINGTDFSLGTILTMTDVYNFFSNTTSAYYQTGFGANINSIPAPITYSPKDRIYKLPMNYGDVDTSNSAYAISIPTLFTFAVEMTRVNEVDGWGTLITPYGTFDALRLKSTIVEVDSIYIDTLLNFGIKLPPITRYEYKWLGIGKGDPLLQINMSSFGSVTSIAYLDSVRSTVGIMNYESINADLNVYPNPAKDFVTVRCGLPSASDVSVDVVDLNGRVITSSEKKHQSSGEFIVVLALPQSLSASANYFVRMNWNGQQVVKPLTIVR